MVTAKVNVWSVRKIVLGMVIWVSLVVSGCGSTLASLYALLGVWEGISNLLSFHILAIFSSLHTTHKFSQVSKCVVFQAMVISNHDLLLRKTAICRSR